MNIYIYIYILYIIIFFFYGNDDDVNSYRVGMLSLLRVVPLLLFFFFSPLIRIKMRKHDSNSACIEDITNNPRVLSSLYAAANSSHIIYSY